ncbi:MAG: hypothetical protein AMXMBFR64_15180 [Myxococcales bacterium]
MKKITVLLAGWLVAAAPALAAVPTSLSVQGTLLTSSGVPVSGTFGMELRFYGQQTGGAPLHVANVPGVSVDGGVFDVTLPPVPMSLLNGDPTLWLEPVVDGDVLPRRPLSVVPYAMAAERANTALVATDLACSGCVGSADVGFLYAGASSKGGAALDLDCPGCVEPTDLAAGAVATPHLQAGAVTAEKVSFPYAGAATAGGPASDVACTGCVAGSDIAANVALAGNVSATGGVAACTNATGTLCAVGIGAAGLYDHKDGWVTLHTSNGLRVRAADPASVSHTALEFGGGTSYGNLAVQGILSVTTSVGIGTTAPVNALDVRGSIDTTSALKVGFFSIGGNGYHPNATVFLRDPSWWLGVVAAADTPWVDNDSFVFNTVANGRPFVWTANGVSSPLMLLETSGNLGIGTTTPAAKLDVAGSFRIGGDNGPCTSGNAGALRWTGSQIEVCDGAAWAAIYSPPPNGGTQAQAGASCAGIKAGGYSHGDATYWIDPNGAPTTDAYQVWCDMTTDGGGWTLVLNLDTSDGHAMWWGNPAWTNSATFGNASAPFGADLKSPAWNSYTGATKILVVVHEQGSYRGWKSFTKANGDSMFQHLQGGDNTLIGSAVINSSTGSVWTSERLVRTSTTLYANHCVQTGGGCTSGTTGSPDGDRIGSHQGTPSDNNGGGLGNWHDMHLCCSGPYGGTNCGGGTVRTCAEAQSGWAPCYGGTGMFGNDACQPPSQTCSDSSCGNSNWSAKNNVNYDYSIFLGGP